VFLVDLFVTASARGRGIGTALMTEVRWLAAAQRATRVVWTIHRLNTPARRFYEGVGARGVPDLSVMYVDV
jgi:GNAT superfamily N-acetyltransferase